jgi:hypothetical protein
MSSCGHGLNIGNGYLKYLVVDELGRELPPVIFPALLAPAQQTVAGAVRQAAALTLPDGSRWWVGEDALLDESPRACLGVERLHDPHFIPALIRAACERLGDLAADGVCVTGLPATWMQERAKAQALGERLRAGTDRYRRIQGIPEPLGMIYALVLDNDGEVAGDETLLTGDVAVIDGGHLTIDQAIVKGLVPLASGLRTWQLGTVKPLAQIAAQLSAHFDREFTPHAVDQIVRRGSVRIAGAERALPMHWDQPLIATGEAIAATLTASLGSGAQFDGILLGGGWALEERLTAPTLRCFPHATIVPDPQLSIARGYARLARRLAFDTPQSPA